MSDASTPSPARSDRGRSGFGPTWLLAGVALVLAAVLVFMLGGGGGAEEPAGSAALAVPLTTAEGGTTTLAELGGQPLVVNFFASWCPPCRAELPDLQKVHRLVGDDVRFVGVNVDYDESTWKSFVASSGITYDTVFEPQQDLLRAVGGKGMPTTALVSGNGEVLYVHTGLLDDAGLLDLIDEHGLR